MEEEPVGISSTEEPNESVEEKVEFKLKEEKEEGLELQAEVKEDVKVDEKEPVESITSTEEVEEKISAGKSVDLDIDKFLEGEPVGLSSTEEFKELVEEVEIEEKKERDLEVQSEVKEDGSVDLSSSGTDYYVDNDGDGAAGFMDDMARGGLLPDGIKKDTRDPWEITPFARENGFGEVAIDSLDVDTLAKFTTRRA